MKIYGVIPARGGSRRIPRKNIRTFHGRPIIEYSIEKLTTLIDGNGEVVVSTEDDEIAHVATRCGALVVPRPAVLAEDSATTQEVVSHALSRLVPKLVLDDLCICLYPCAPLVNVGDMQTAIMQLLYGGGSFVASVGVDPLRDAGAFYVGTAGVWLSVPIFGTHTRLHVLPDERVCDINTPEDWAEAEMKFASLRRAMH